MDSQGGLGSAALPPGTRLQQYVIERLLGTPGRYAVTYLANDAEHARQVVLKEFFPAEFLRREGQQLVALTESAQSAVRWALLAFVDEARVLMRVAHPALADVYAVFEDNGSAYAAMEYLPGETLAQVLARDRRMSETRLLDLFAPLLEGLQAAHDEGFLHRDIKPAKVYFREDGSPVLVDFGAAQNALRFKCRRLADALTPSYAAPESYALTGRQGAWTDLYALGALAYQALSGRAPTDAAERLGGRLLSPAINAGRGFYSREFLEAVDWALRLDPQQRPASAQAWLLALTGSAAVPALPKPVQAPPRSEPAQPPAALSPPPAVAVAALPRATPATARRRAPLAIAAVLIAAGAAAALWWSNHPSAVPPEAPAPQAPVPAVAAPAAAPPAASPAAAPPPPDVPDVPAEDEALTGLERLALDLMKRDDEAQKLRAEQQAEQERLDQIRREEARLQAERARATGTPAPSAAPAAAAPQAPESAERALQLERELAQLRAEREQQERAVQEAERAREQAAQRQAESRAQLEGQRQLRLAEEKKLCREHVSDMIGGRAVIYADVAAMPSVRKLPNGQLMLPPLSTDDGRKVSLTIDSSGCVVQTRLVR